MIFALTQWIADASGLELDAAIAAVEPRVIEWRRNIHQHPELSNQEFRTAALVAEHLRGLGMQVKTEVAHTGVIGTLVGNLPGPVVALRADMDALPVVEQTGLSFASTVVTQYNGEEGGAKLMVKEGVLDGPDAPEVIFGLHVFPLETGSIYYRARGALAAADWLTITVTGRQTHGSLPWLGVDPITVAAQIIMALQTIPSRQLDITNAPALVTIGSIHGGVRGNIIPDTVEMSETIRTFDRSMRDDFHDRIIRTVENIAESAGGSAEVIITEATPVTFNDVALTRRMLPTLQWAAGRELVFEARPITGAEDFAYFQEKIPGLYVGLGVNKQGVPAWESPPNHSPLFFVNEDALLVGVRTMVGFALNYAGSE